MTKNDKIRFTVAGILLILCIASFALGIHARSATYSISMFLSFMCLTAVFMLLYFSPYWLNHPARISNTILILLSIATPIFLFIPEIRSDFEATELKENGVLVWGTVTKVYQVEEGKRGTHSYAVIYFKAGREKFTPSISNDGKSFKAGDAVEIAYAPSGPFLFEVRNVKITPSETEDQIYQP